MSTISWVNVAGGDWNTGSNWSGGIVPTAADDAIIATPGTYAITTAFFGASFAAHSVTLSDPAASVTFGTSSTLALGGTLLVNAGTFSLGGTIAGGTIDVVGGSFGFAGLSSGTLSGVTVEGALAPTFSLSSFLYISGGLRLEGAGGVGAGTLSINGGTVLFSGSQTVSGGTIALAPGFSTSSFQQSGQGTLTLAPNLTIIAPGENDLISGNIANQGLISIASGARLSIGGLLANAGTLALAQGGALSLSAPLTNTGTIIGTGATISVSGPATDAELVSLASSGAAIVAAGAVDNTGGTLSVGPGGSIPLLTVGFGGVISNGVVLDPNGSLVVNGGSLSDVTYRGTLVARTGYASNPSATVVNGLTLLNAGGNGPGVLDIEGAVAFNTTETIAAGTITLGGTSSVFSLGNGFSPGVQVGLGSVLTLGPQVVVQHTGLGDEIRGNLVNQGLIQANRAGGGLEFDPGSTLTNQGTIIVSNGDTLVVAGSLANTGTIIGAGGTIIAAGSVTGTELLSLSGSGAAIVLTGTLDNSGGTLVVGPGQAIQQLALGSGGMISNGVVLDPNGSLLFGGGTLLTGGGTLSGLTYEGTLVARGFGVSFPGGTIVNGLTLLNAGGNGPGVLDIEGGVAFNTTETIASGTVTLGGTGSVFSLGSGSDPGMQVGLGSVLTLGPQVVLQHTGLGDEIRGNLVNQGLIRASRAGGVLEFDPGSTLTNQGTIIVSNGETLVVAGSLVNTGTIIGAGGTIALAGVVTEAELLSLGASGAAIVLAGALDNTGGTLAVGPGQAVSQLTLGSGGVISNGVLRDPNGSLVINGGTLADVTYQGTLVAHSLSFFSGPTITGGSTFQGLGGVGPGAIDLLSGTLAFAGNQTLSGAGIILGPNGGFTPYAPVLAQTGPGSLTLAPDVTVNVETTNGSISGTVANQGLISIIRGADLPLTGSFSNAGTLAIAAGGTLTLASALANTGTIIGPGGTIIVGGSVTGAELLSLSGSGAAIVLTGTLDNSGGTLAVGPGQAIPQLTLGSGGAISNGIIRDPNGTFLFSGGTLSGVTYEGTLVARGPGLIFPGGAIVNGLTLLNAGRNGPGVLDIEGGVAFNTTETIVSGTIALGGTGYVSNLGNGSNPGMQVGLGNVLTLGPQVVMQHTGLGDDIRGNLVNQGLIQANRAGGGLELDASATLTNQGTIIVSGGDTLVLAGSLANSGTLSIAAGGTLDIAGGTLSNTGSFSFAGGVLELTGTVTPAQLQADALLGASILFAGTIDEAGGTLAIGAGQPITALTLAPSGVIRNASLIDKGGLVVAGGTLDGVAYQGAIGLTHPHDALTIVNGITSSGPINVTGDGASLSFSGSQTLNARVNIGGAGSAANIYNGSTLTLGPSTVITQTGRLAGFSGFSGTLVNAGMIQAAFAGGSLSFGSFVGGGLDNTGTIAVANGEVVSIPNLVNAGSVGVSAGGVLTLGTYASAGGRLSETNATLNLNGPLTLPALGTISRSGGIVSIGAIGSLDLGGGTLAIGGASALGQLRDNGVIANGTIADAGGGMVFYGGSGTLQNVTYRGVVNLTPALSSLVVQGFTATAAGGGAGSVNVLGAGSSLVFRGSQSFDNATINLGSNVKTATLTVQDMTGAGAALTIGAKGNLQHRGALAEIDVGRGLGDALVNNGLIAANAANGNMIVLGGTFTNAGRVVVAGGDTLSLEADRVSNLAGNLLNGGYWEVDANSTLNLGFDNPILNMNAVMVLNGPGSQVLYYDTTKFQTTSLEQSLHYVGPAGVLVIENSRAFNDPGLLSVVGKVVLSDGTLSANPVAINSTALLMGTGTVSANAIYDSGHVLAQGGALVLNAPLLAGNPMGNALIAADSTLVANAAVAVPVQFLANTGTLVLGQARSMSGTIFGFTKNDAIDLVNVGTAGLGLSYAAGGGNGVLTVTSGGSIAATLHFHGAYVLANFSTIADGHGGTLLLDPPLASSADWKMTQGDFGATQSGVIASDTTQGGTLAAGFGPTPPADPSHALLLSHA